MLKQKKKKKFIQNQKESILITYYELQNVNENNHKILHWKNQVQSITKKKNMSFHDIPRVQKTKSEG